MSLTTEKQDGMKMTRKHAAMAAVVMAVLMGVLTGCQTPEPSSIAVNVQYVGEPSSADQARVLAKYQHGFDLQIIAGRAHDRQAKALANFFMNETICVRPAENGIIPVEQKPGNKARINVLFLQTGEEPEWCQVGNRNMPIAEFRTDIPALVVYRHDQASSTLVALALFHELWHAGAFYHNQKKFVADIYGQEVDAYQFMHRIAAKLGGAAYKQALDEQVEFAYQLQLKAQATQANVSAVLPPYDTRLDQTFLPSTSEYDRTERRGLLWNHAMFTMIDKHGRGNKRGQKAGVIKARTDSAIGATEGANLAAQ